MNAKEDTKFYKEIIKDYGNKAKAVNEKYISSPISTDFACVYVPSESLYLELSTHVTEKKELWISEIQKKYKVTYMGPSTFSAYCGAILLGFKTISVDKRSQNFSRHLDKFKKLLDTNFKSAEASQNKAEAAAKSATEVFRSSEKLNNDVVDYFKKENFIVTSNSYFDILYDNDIAKVDPDYLFEVITKMDLGEAEAIFLSCTNLPALNIVDKLEKK